MNPFIAIPSLITLIAGFVFIGCARDDDHRDSDYRHYPYQGQPYPGYPYDGPNLPPPGGGWPPRGQEGWPPPQGQEGWPPRDHGMCLPENPFGPSRGDHLFLDSPRPDRTAHLISGLWLEPPQPNGQGYTQTAIQFHADTAIVASKCQYEGKTLFASAELPVQITENEIHFLACGYYHAAYDWEGDGRRNQPFAPNQPYPPGAGVPGRNQVPYWTGGGHQGGWQDGSQRTPLEPGGGCPVRMNKGAYTYQMTDDLRLTMTEPYSRASLYLEKYADLTEEAGELPAEGYPDSPLPPVSEQRRDGRGDVDRPYRLRSPAPPFPGGVRFRN